MISSREAWCSSPSSEDALWQEAAWQAVCHRWPSVAVFSCAWCPEDNTRSSITHGSGHHIAIEEWLSHEEAEWEENIPGSPLRSTKALWSCYTTWWHPSLPPFTQMHLLMVGLASLVRTWSYLMITYLQQHPASPPDLLYHTILLISATIPIGWESMSIIEFERSYVRQTVMTYMYNNHTTLWSWHHLCTLTCHHVSADDS